MKIDPVQPTKQDTLVEKAEKRSRNLLLGRSFINFSSHWWIGTREKIAISVLILLNFLLLLPFFGQEDPNNVFSAPLIPTLAQATSLLLPYTYGVRLWLLIFLLLFPAVYYFFVREITARKLAAFLATVFTSLPIGILLSLRANMGLLSEDGGQVASLTITMSACLLLHRFLRGGNYKTGIAASISVALVALTSPLGLFVLFCMAVAITFSEMLLNQGRLKATRFLVVFILATGLCAFWYNPKFILLLINSSRGDVLKETLSNIFPLTFFLAPVLGAFGFLLFENRPQLQPLALAIFLSIGFGLLSLGTGSTFSSPSRFLPTLGLSLSFLTGLAFTKIFDYLNRPGSFSRFKVFQRFQRLALILSSTFFVLALFLIIDVYGKKLRYQSEPLVLGVADIKKSGIWQIRQDADGLANIIGGLISLGTIGFTVKIGKKIQQYEHATVK